MTVLIKGQLRQFTQQVDKRSRNEMCLYLAGHFRYHTMNSWNRSTSYAHCVKIPHLGLPRDLEDKAYELLEIRGTWDPINKLIREWERDHGYRWQVGFNGRSSGYIVLYQGGTHPDGTVFSYPGKGLDMDESFSTWDMESLRDRVYLVQEFDQLVQDIFDCFVWMCKNMEVQEEEILVPRTIKVLVKKGDPNGRVVAVQP